MVLSTCVAALIAVSATRSSEREWEGLQAHAFDAPTASGAPARVPVHGPLGSSVSDHGSRAGDVARGEPRAIRERAPHAPLPIVDAGAGHAQPLPAPPHADDRCCEGLEQPTVIATLQAELDALEQRIGRLKEHNAYLDALLRSRNLEASMRGMLRDEFPGMFEGHVAREELRDQLVEILRRVAHTTGSPTLTDVREALPDSSIAQLAEQLPELRRELALTPSARSTRVPDDQEGFVASWSVSYPALRSGRVIVATVLHGLSRDDPRVQRARGDRADVQRRQERAIEAVIGLPIYTASEDRLGVTLRATRRD